MVRAPALLRAHVVLCAPSTFQNTIAGANGVLIDVRTPDEWAEGVTTGARLMNFRDKEFEPRLAALERNVPVLIYGAAGGRGPMAARRMANMGFARICELEHHMQEWLRAGQPVMPPGSTPKE